MRRLVLFPVALLFAFVVLLTGAALICLERLGATATKLFNRLEGWSDRVLARLE